MSLDQLGFCCLESIYCEAECEEILKRIDLLNKSNSSAGTRCMLSNDWCVEVATELRTRLESWMPGLSNNVCVQCTYFNKSSAKNWLVPFHQDRSIPVEINGNERVWKGVSKKEGITFIQGPDTLMSQMLAIRLHLDDSNELNGPLRVIPGTHKSGSLKQGEIDRVVSGTEQGTLVVKRGGAVLMRPLLLHASSKAIETQPRRVLHFLYGPRSLPEGIEWRGTV